MQVPSFHGNIGFNAHHSPMGAYFTFTCGHFGTRGGLATQLGKPANQDLFIGIKEGGRHDRVPVRCLPFFDGARAFMTDPEASFTLERASADDPQPMSAYGIKEMSRHYAWSTDTWKTKDFEFALFTPFDSIPDPAKTNSAGMRAALLPAITAEIVVDNRKGAQTKTAFFAINFNEGGARILDEGLSSGRVGYALRDQLGVAAEAVEIKPDGTRLGSNESGIHPFLFMRWTVQEGLEEKHNPIHLLGSVPGVGVEVPPGKLVVLRLALGCYLAGTVTTRLEGRYLYTRYFTNLLDVLNEALTYHRFVKVDCNTLNDRLLQPGAGGIILNRDQQFLIAHATRSYYANTQLLEIAGQPYWIVNEGEYCMINTLDLAVDHMFWELEWNPWVVRNLLDNFTRFYSYNDQVKNVGQPAAVGGGGISFCHDQGANNQFSPFGRSSYELTNIPGCFSYMTQEQLCNWILLATSYVAATNDRDWTRHNAGTLHNCYDSMLARVNPTTGIMACDSTLAGTGQEITTYDSLDTSLGQARNNLYIAVKCWASYLGLASLFQRLEEPSRAHAALDAARRIQTTLHTLAEKSQPLPAVFEKENPGYASRILPAIEPLIYPFTWKLPNDLLSPFMELYSDLKTHTAALLADAEHRNHFPDGGIRLSSTSDNSWASKIAIIEHVARELFNLDEDGATRKYKGDASGWEKSDAAHTQWQTEGESAFWAASDQIIKGVARGSKYYPRLITAALWMKAPRG